MYRAHPWLLTATAMCRQVMGPHQLGWLDAALAALEPTGLTAPQRHQVFLLAIGLVRNLAQQLLDDDEAHRQEWSRLTGELLERHADRFPALNRAIADGAFGTTGTTGTDGTADTDPLDFGLERVLDGVEALIARTGTERVPSR